ncbi:omega-conotoxin-like protein 1 [Lasioglossum baleicum]|uniref:omega-conotoxin-like protein 1 n=1 Tax=Lasioglossum baleicum TaxID=434251 RepID=UPI003FCDC195
MSKLMLYIFVAMLTMNVVMGASTSCGRHGDSCVSDSNCCAGIKCHRYAHRCQVQITSEELMAQREKILGRKGKDY